MSGAKKKKRKKAAGEERRTRPGPPPAPTFLAATAAVVRLQWLRSLRSRKLRVALAATGLVVLFPAVLAPLIAESADPADVVRRAIEWGFLRLLVFLLPLLFASGAIAEEIENRTLPYLTVRPSGRVPLALGKYLVTAGWSAAVIAAAMVVLHLAAYSTSPGHMVDDLEPTARALGACLLLVGAYSAICMLWGALVPEAAGLLSVIHLGLIELVFSAAPGVVRLMSLNYYGRLVAGLPRGGFGAEWVPEIEVYVAALAILGGGVFFLGGALLSVSASELRYGRA